MSPLFTDYKPDDAESTDCKSGDAKSADCKSDLSLFALIVCLLALLIAPKAASAGFSYTYLELGYGYVDSNGNGGGDGGPYGALSAQVKKRMHIFSEYQSAGDGFVLGIGGNYPVDKKLDLIGRLGWADLAGADGVRVEAGFRLRAASEINAGLFFWNLDTSSDTGVYLGAVATIQGPLALTGRLRFSDHATQANFGLRIHF
jgi:hypothetical protein